MSARREDILALARAIALSDDESSDDVGERASDEPRALSRRRAFVPLEERAERRDAPFRPPGDRLTAPRLAEAAVRARQASTSGVDSETDAEKTAKENSKMLLALPEVERPIIEQAFSMRAPAKVPRAVRQRFLDALVARKLRETAKVGPREAVSARWILDHPKERSTALENAVKEEARIHAKATSKITYRNLAAQLMLRGGESEKPAPGALKQDYRCEAADCIDLSRARTVRGEALSFFLDACRHRSGNAHSRWMTDESTELEGEEDAKEKTTEADFDQSAAVNIEQTQPKRASPDVAVSTFCHEYIQRLCDSGAYDEVLATTVAQKVIDKVMARHRDKVDGSFVSKESSSIRKLIVSQFEAETKRARLK